MEYCNKSNMTKLVEALESGKYKQTTGTLRRNDNFCCLGVACELFDLEEKPDLGWDLGTYNGHGGYLPPVVMNWLCVADHELPVEYESQETAAKMNDSDRTFAEIAEALKETYLEKTT